jgi:hypothetical protein
MNRFGLTLMFGALAFTAQADTFTGVITDTMCGAKHGMMKNQPDDQCVKMCTKGQSTYALFDGTNVIKLSDQKTPAKFAAQKVKVTGTLDARTNTIKVSSVEPADGK